MTEPHVPERFGPLVRRDDWRESERAAVDEALGYAEEMLELNFHLIGDIPNFYWWVYFDYALLADYSEWKWDREPQLGLEEFAAQEESA